MSGHPATSNGHAPSCAWPSLEITPVGDIGETRAFVFSFDEAYAKYFSVALTSLAQNVDKGRRYDIVVLHDCVTERTMNRLRDMVPENFSLRFFDVGELAREAFGDLGALVYLDQWDVSTFYDLLVPIVMPRYGRVLYCDCDLVFCKDPDELFRMPTDGKQLIAVRDSLMLALQMTPDNPFLWEQADFLEGQLHISSLEGYFNGGVLLFDVPSIDAKDYREKVAGALALPKLPTVDQDVLNSVFKDRVKIAPQHLNLQAHVMSLPREGTPPKEMLEYLDAARSPVIVHYTTPLKPWSNISCPLGTLFWRYTRLSPFFDDIIEANHLEGRRKLLSGFDLGQYVKYAILSRLAPGGRRAGYRQSLEIQRGFIATKGAERKGPSCAM